MIKYLINSDKIYSEEKDLYGIYIFVNRRNLTLSHYKNLLKAVLKDDKVLTLNECRANLNSRMRPNPKEWNDIMNALLENNYIFISELSRNKTKKVKLS